MLYGSCWCLCSIMLSSLYRVGRSKKKIDKTKSIQRLWHPVTLNSRIICKIYESYFTYVNTHFYSKNIFIKLYNHVGQIIFIFLMPFWNNKFWNFCFNNIFINGSTNCLSVLTYWISISSILYFSQIKLSICLDTILFIKVNFLLK